LSGITARRCGNDSIVWTLALLLAGSLLVVLATRRRSRDGRDSVQAEHQRLEALRNAVRAAEPGTGPEPRPRGPSAGAEHWPRDRAARVSWRLSLTAAAVLLLVAGALGAVAQVVGRGDPVDAPSGGSSSSAAAAPTTTTTTRPPTTSTTRAFATAVVTGEDTIAVSVPSGAYELSLAARDDCWIHVQPAGAEAEEATIEAGERRTFSASGPTTLRLGNPAVVDVSIDGRALTLPLEDGDPVDIEFAPAPPG
jgi:hypothetical protein